MPPDGRALAAEKLRRIGAPDVTVEAFGRRYARLASGEQGLLPSAELEPVLDVPALEDLPPAPAGDAGLDRVVVLKLNGGLGTTMGLHHAKSLVEVRPGLRFLDVIARQVLALRRRHGARIPLVLMNSFATRDVRAPVGEQDVPASFLQHRYPRLRADDLRPVEWPDDPALEWAPPGHGDVYDALVSSGMLSTLLERGYTHAFLSNADNLGAVLEPRVLAWVLAQEIPFLMEVVEGTEADRKGGHIARRDGRLVLRETAQTPPDEADTFRDFRRWRHYNTNNLWIDLRVLGREPLDLPLIVNRKTVVAGDDTTPEVIQLETAMGAALGAIDGAAVLRVPRTRFAPVKTTDDLLVVRSDFYALGEDGLLQPAAPEPPVVTLDPPFYRALPDFDRRFPHGPPSLARARRLAVRGDVTFGRDVVVTGEAEVEGPRTIEDGAVLGDGGR